MKVLLFAHPFVSRTKPPSFQSLQKRVQADTKDGRAMAHSANSVFATMAGDVGTSSFVQLINFCVTGQVSALKPPQRKYANR